jgi:hypothetical protein
MVLIWYRKWKTPGLSHVLKMAHAFPRKFIVTISNIYPIIFHHNGYGRAYACLSIIFLPSSSYMIESILERCWLDETGMLQMIILAFSAHAISWRIGLTYSLNVALVPGYGLICKLYGVQSLDQKC